MPSVRLDPVRAGEAAVRGIDDLTRAIPVYGPNGETLGPHLDRDLWKSVRGPLIGSSDSPAIVGRNEYVGPWDVWDRIVLGEWNDPPDDSEPGADIRRGNRQEANALQRFQEVHQIDVVRAGMLAHPDEPRVVADVDALIPVPDEWPDVIRASDLWSVVIELGGPGVLEAKVPRKGKFYRIREEGLPADWLVQGQHHGLVTGCRWGVFNVYTPEFDDVTAFPFVVDVEWCAWLLGTLRKWHDRHVRGLSRPDRFAPPPARWPTKVPGVATLREDDAWMDAATVLTMRHYELEEAQKAHAEAQAAVLALLDEEGQHVAGGGVTVRRYSTPSQTRTDTKALLAKIRLAQLQGDAEALLTLDPNAHTFQTRSSEKVKVDVFGPNPFETGAGIDQAPAAGVPSSDGGA